MTEVKKFGLLFAAICAGLSLFLFFKENDLWLLPAAGAVFFLVTGLVAQPVLQPVYTVWMKLAHVLAWINTRILLGLFFYLVLTPVGVVMRLLGKDLLDKKIDRAAPTYWVKREETSLRRNRYERLF